MARLFQSLVICGAGLTLVECGGRYAGRDAGDDGGATSGAGSGNTAGHASGGGGGGSAGGVGGAVSTTGGLNLGGLDPGGTSAGGSSTSTGGSAVTEPAGAEAQLECNPAQLGGCSSIDTDPSTLAFRINSPCHQNAMRPKGPEDCPTGSRFTCMIGDFQGKLQYFDCDCLGAPQDSCACPDIGTGCSRPTPSTCGSGQTYCGCAYTCILK